MCSCEIEIYVLTFADVVVVVRGVAVDDGVIVDVATGVWTLQKVPADLQTGLLSHCTYFNLTQTRWLCVKHRASQSYRCN